MKKYDVLVVTFLFMAYITLYKVSYAEPINRIQFSLDSHSRKFIVKTISIFMLNFIVILPIFIVSLLFSIEKRTSRAIFVTLTSFLASQSTSSLLSNILKLLFGEYRPDYYSRCKFVQENSENKNFILLNGIKSFPSGHTADAFSASVFTTCFIYGIVYSDADSFWKKTTYGVLSAFLIITAPLVGVERVLHNKHFIHDVFAGSLIGIFSGLVFYYVVYEVLKSIRIR